MAKIRNRHWLGAIGILTVALWIVYLLFHMGWINASIFSVLSAAIIAEALLRVVYGNKLSKPATDALNKSFKPFLKSHPYLPFVYKENVLIPMLPKNLYDFMSPECSFPEIKTNNKGHLNGPCGNRVVADSKKAGSIRISSLGDSVSANYIHANGTNYNFSVEIERQLKKLIKRSDIEVNNCAIGGYTLLDILVKFIVKDIHEHPDYIVINHGYSNLRSYLCGKYNSDNTHFRKNFVAGEFRYKLARFIPFKSSYLYKKIFSLWFPTDIKDFLKYVSIGDIDIDSTWKGLDYFEANLNNLISIALANKIAVVLCTCPHFLHPKIMHSKAHQKFSEGMNLQNEIIRKVAKARSVYLVDNEKQVKANSNNFIDVIHLSPIGMQVAAAGVADILKALLVKETCDVYN